MLARPTTSPPAAGALPRTVCLRRALKEVASCHAPDAIRPGLAGKRLSET
jgi:hypothetical protein